MSRRKQNIPDKGHDDQDGGPQQKMRRGSSSASKEQVVCQRDLRVTRERAKKLEQQGMDYENIRETRSRRSTAGKKPIRLMDTGALHTRKLRKTSSTTSTSSIKDTTMTSESVDSEEQQTEEVTRRRRLGVLRKISESPVKKTRGRPPKMINRQVEIETAPAKVLNDSTENGSVEAATAKGLNDLAENGSVETAPAKDLNDLAENGSAKDLNDLAENGLSDDVFDNTEQMMETGNGDGEIAKTETTGSVDDVADMEVSTRDASNRKEISEHESPRDINEVSSSTGGSGGEPDGNSCERHVDETKASENGEAYQREEFDDDSQAQTLEAVLRAKERLSPTGGAETTRPAAATEGDDITAAEAHELTSQGHKLNASDDITGAEAHELTSQGHMLNASDPGDQGSVHGSEGMSVDGRSMGEGNSDSGGSDGWEAQQRLYDGDGMAMSGVPDSPGSAKYKERRRRPMEGSDKRTCDICMESFMSPHELTQHIRKHNSVNSHICKVCSKTLSSASSLDRHMLIHSGERPFRCTLCPMAFTTNGNMHRHMRTHEKEGVDIEEYVLRGEYTRPRKRVPTKRLLDSGEYTTSPAKKMTLSNRVVYAPVDDMQLNEGETLNCPVCDKSFLCKYSLQTHMDLHPNLALRCSMCDNLFRNHRGLRMHIQMTHKKNSETNKDDENIPLGFQDLSFMEFSTNKFPLVAQVWCEQNVRRCNSIDHRFICHACNKAFPCNSALDLHVKDAHSNQNTGNFSGSPSSDKENAFNSAMEHFAVIDSLDEVEKEECQKEFMAALQLKPVLKIRKVLPAVVPATPGGLLMVPNGPLMVPNGPLARETIPRDFYNYGIKAEGVANPLLGPSKPRVMDFADVQQILKMTSDSGNPLSLLSHQPGQSKRSPLKGLTPDMMASGTMPGEFQAAQLPILPLPPMTTNIAFRTEPLSGDIATEMHIPMEDAKNHRLQMPFPSDLISCMDDDDSSQFGSESDSESLYGSRKLMKGKMHTCKYCDKLFPFASTLKVHLRSHLGLTPYKCQLCPYSSADKSTLVRHMRTHSGERPYACKICKFPFTTKANCERHIKKRHHKDTKIDIELCIESYQQSHTGLDGKFCSPDTICKICNRDFKFFRDLQNHLRVHERTPLKPFVCQRCQMGFTSRGNCARHIVKSHPEVGESNIEKTIVVHEVTFSDTQSITTDDSTYLDDVMTSDTPQTEALDFSLKGGKFRDSPSPRSIPSPIMFNLDSPMDLSLRKPGSIVGRLRFKRVYHKFYSRLIDGLVCPHCSQAFAHGSLFKQHIRSHTTERPHRCYFCAAAFTMKENLDKHIEKRHSISAMMERPAQAFIPKIATPMQFKLNVARNNQAIRQQSPFDQSDDGTSTPTLPPQQQGELSIVTDMMTSLPPNPHKSPVIVNTNYNSNSTDSSVELSSISRILANASSNNLQNLLTPPLMSTNASPLLMTALSSNTIMTNQQMATQEARKVPVIMKTTQHRMAEDPDVMIIKQEPRSDSPARSIGSPSQLIPYPVPISQQPQPFPSDFIPHSSQMVPNDNFQRFSQMATADMQHSIRSETPQDFSGEQDQIDEPIPLEKTPAGKELLRKQTCPYCFRKFPWISSLKRHILTHTGLKPYQCPQCGSSFSTKSNCERHIVRRHGGSGSRESSIENSPAGTPSGIPPLEQLFVCLECREVAFSTKKKLEKHYETHHPTSIFPDCYIEPRRVDIQPPQMPAASSALDLSVKSPTSPRPSQSFHYSPPPYHHPHHYQSSHQSSHHSSHHHHHHQSSVIKEGKRLLKKAAAVQMKKRIHEYGQIHDEEILPGSPYDAVTSGNYNDLVMKFTVKPSQHSCHMCSKRFKSSTALKRHHRVHTLEHPFQCLKCQASFTTKFNCQRHMQKLHGMSKEEVAAIKEVEMGQVDRSHDLPTMVAFGEPGQLPMSSIDDNGNVHTSTSSAATTVTTTGETLTQSENEPSNNYDTESADLSTRITNDTNRLQDQSNYPINDDISNISATSTLVSEPDNSISNDTQQLSSTNHDFGQDKLPIPIIATQIHLPSSDQIRSQSNSPSLTVRKQMCITPDGDVDDEDNEDIKKFKELDPDITIVNPKTPSEEGDDAKNMTWTLDSNITASPEESDYMEGCMEQPSTLTNQGPEENSSESFSTPADEMMSSGMDNSDIIQNLLGIQDSSVIDQMLDTGDSQTAAKLLGV